MVMARLHVICGNCGCNDLFKFKIEPEGHDDGERAEPAVWITCSNCSTIHDLSDTVREDKPDRCNRGSFSEDARMVKQEK